MNKEICIYLKGLNISAKSLELNTRNNKLINICNEAGYAVGSIDITKLTLKFDYQDKYTRYYSAVEREQKMKKEPYAKVQ
jgi:hypothetical protein